MPAARACLFSAFTVIAAFGLFSQALADSTGDAAQATDGAPVASAGAKDVNAQIKDWIDASPDVPPRHDVAADGPLGPPDRAIHGEWGVGVGTQGYRSAYGVAVIPLGDRGTATVAASADRFRARGWGMNRQSFALNLDLDGARSARLASACPFDRYSHGGLEPSWVGPLRGRDDRFAADCRADRPAAAQECSRLVAPGPC